MQNLRGNDQMNNFQREKLFGKHEHHQAFNFFLIFFFLKIHRTNAK